MPDWALDSIERLKSLYVSGYRSEVIDRSVAKLLDVERFRHRTPAGRYRAWTAAARAWESARQDELVTAEKEQPTGRA